MSGFFGVYNRDSQSVSVDVLEGMQEVMAWEPDATGLWHAESVGLGHAMLWNTPESKLEQLPSEQDGLVISMDARLDNRDELVQKLELTDRPLEQIRESEFILKAYQKWGEACPEHLIGDFAFVIWDERKQQLFCARDHVGVKQFYFHLVDEYFICANDLRVLVSHPAVSTKINDETVANFLVNNQLESDILTFFESIEKLPPAHSVTITANGVRKKCYWRLENAPAIKLPNAEACVKKLRELLEKAVHDRLRSDYPITSHLSGGLDSSAIAVIAARKLREKNQQLLAFNWLHEPTEDDDPEHFEWSYSQIIANAENIDHHYVPLTAEDIYGYMKKRTVVYGDTYAFWYEYVVHTAARSKKSRTILSGWGGDELATYHSWSYYADMLLQGKISRTIKELKLIADKQKKKRFKRLIGLLYHRIILVIVPRKLYRFMPRNNHIDAGFPRFIKKSFQPLIEKELNKTSVLTMQPYRSIKKDMLAYWQSGHIQARIESWSTLAISSRLEYSYPLLDKQVLEFVVGLPAEYFVKDNVGRYLFRSAVKDLLPAEILWNTNKVENNRVERIVSLELTAWKLWLDELTNKEYQSSYINNSCLYQAIGNLNIADMEKNPLLFNEDIEAAISVVLSEELK